MNFDFSDEQKELKDQARRFLDARSTPKAVRVILEGPEAYDRTLWQGLAEMGFLGIAIPEEYGGVGAGYLELCALAEEMGRALAPVPFSSTVFLGAEFLKAAGSDAQKKAWLPRIAAGEAIGALAVAEGAGRLSPKSIKASFVSGRLTGVKSIVLDGDVADFVIVAARNGNGEGERGIGLYLVDMKGPGITRAPLKTIDPSRSQAKLSFDGAAAEPLGDAAEGWSILTDVLDRAAVLSAFEQIGGADRALEMGRDYALGRFAFGRPIGTFQAIKHMLADMYVSATLARSNAYWGAWALATGAAELPVAAASARVSATQAYQHCAKNNIQVHGGMGFTWEFDCHLHYRRANLLALSLGSLSEWEDRLIDSMRKRNAA